MTTCVVLCYFVSSSSLSSGVFLNHPAQCIRLVSIITRRKITNFSPFASNDGGWWKDDRRRGREISVNFVLYKFTSYFILPNASDGHRRAINHSIYGNTYVMVTLHTSCYYTSGAMNCVALAGGNVGDQSLLPSWKARLKYDEKQILLRLAIATHATV